MIMPNLNKYILKRKSQNYSEATNTCSNKHKSFEVCKIDKYMSRYLGASGICAVYICKNDSEKNTLFYQIAVAPLPPICGLYTQWDLVVVPEPIIRDLYTQWYLVGVPFPLIRCLYTQWDLTQLRRKLELLENRWMLKEYEVPRLKKDKKQKIHVLNLIFIS